VNNLIYDTETTKFDTKKIDNHEYFVFLAVFNMDNKFLIVYKCDDEISNNIDISSLKQYIIKRIFIVNKQLTDEKFDWLDLNNPKDIDTFARLLGIDTKGYKQPNELEEVTLAYGSSANIVMPVAKDRYTVDTILTNKKSYYITDFNGINYDTTMLALFFEDTMGLSTKSLPPHNLKLLTIRPVLAKVMYQYNDALFRFYRQNMPSFLNNRPIAKNIRQNWLNSGKHIDVPKLSGADDHIALKEIAGNLGLQIIENQNVKGDKSNSKNDFGKQLADLIAYCVSDVLCTKDILAHPFYNGNMTVNKELINSYPQLKYNYKINEKGIKVPDPLNPRTKLPSLDDTSANRTGTIIAPYDKLKDYKYISYMYPSEENAKKHGINRINVLEFVKDFFYTNITEPKARAEFDKVYNLYKSFEGKNVNESDWYTQLYGYIPTVSTKEKKITIPIFRKDGTWSNVVITMSTGGTHGCMIDISKNFKDISYDELVKTINTFSVATKQKTRFTYAGKVLHADFSSYYPMLLVMLSIFKNEYDADEYYQIYELKEKFGNDAKQYKKIGDTKNVKLTTIKRTGTKQSLNSATGKADEKGDRSKYNNIQMNNAIFSMRCIGQMFTYVIAQWIGLLGGDSVSTNTDGLYASNISDKNIDVILNYIYDKTRIKIDPEKIYLVSKDSNNRCEFDENFELKEAKGSLGGVNGPIVNKSATNFAIVPNLLVEYFKLMLQHNIDFKTPLNKDLMLHMLKNVYFKDDKGNVSNGQKLLMFSRLIKASNSSYRFPVLTTQVIPELVKDENVTPLSHYSRIFLVKPEFNNAHLMQLEYKTINKTSLKKREQLGERRIQHNENVRKTLEQIKQNLLLKEPIDREGVVSKVTNIKPTYNVVVVNDNLFLLDKEFQEKLLDNLDLDAYLDVISLEYENWQN